MNNLPPRKQKHITPPKQMMGSRREEFQTTLDPKTKLLKYQNIKQFADSRTDDPEERRLIKKMIGREPAEDIKGNRHQGIEGSHRGPDEEGQGTAREA